MAEFINFYMGGGKVKNYSTTLGGGVHMIDLLLWFKSSYPETVTTYANNICINQ